jgi:hypothetical protein
MLRSLVILCGTNGHRRDLVYSQMLTQLMTPSDGRRHLTIGEAIDLPPAAFGGAQKGARQVTSEMNDGKASIPTKGTKVRQNRDTRLSREQNTLEKWFEHHAADLPKLDRPPTLRDVETFLSDHF